MSIEEILAGITILGFLFGIAKWLIKAAGDLVKAITELKSSFDSLGSNFSTFKAEAINEHKETRIKLDDHETRIHTLEDWKKYREEEER